MQEIEIMLERLKRLEDNIKDLKDFRSNLNINDLKNNKEKEWALRYGLLETIQIIIDISCHIVSKYNLGNPETYGDCVRMLAQFNYIKEDLSKKLIGMIGLRNILIHEYISIDLNKLYSLLNDDIEDFIDFIEFMKDII